MMFYRQKLLFLSTFLLGVCSITLPSQAYLRIDQIAALSYDMEKPEDVLAKEMEVHQEKPFGDESLSMEVTLPIGWHRYETETLQDSEKSNKRSAEGLSKKKNYQIEKGGDIFRMLVRYSTPPRIERRSEFRVRSIEINSLISLENWFTELILQMGFSPEGIKKVSEGRLDAQYTIFEYGEPMVTRAVVTRSGNKIIIAEYMVHQENYDREKDLQIYAMKQFKMLAPRDDLPIALNTYPFVDIAKFQYPQNWLLYTPGITTIERMEASVINLRGMSEDQYSSNYTKIQMNGRVDVSVVYKGEGVTAESEMALIGQSLKDNGLVLSDRIDLDKDFRVHEKISKSSVSVYHIIPPVSTELKTNLFNKSKAKSNKLADYEYWVGILETSGRYYFVRLLTIGRDEDFRAWAENTEVFRVLLGSISPVNDDIH
ncbi:MAG: hypothetical protein RBR86_04790 [Pseudobdellovibrionaceae bacterium]|nr:hypothetical protein [Pseudobdellovibrionaceae bacterium]